MSSKVNIETVETPRSVKSASGSSKGRGRPIADLVETFEQGSPELVEASGLSSAALRAADLIRSMRKEARLSQAELAERIGVQPSRVSELEAGLGRQGPTWDVMERIAAACGKQLATQEALEAA